MKNEAVRNEVAMYWRLMQDLRNCHSPEDICEAVEEMEVLSEFTESDTLRRLCLKTISVHRPLQIVSAPG